MLFVPFPFMSENLKHRSKIPLCCFLFHDYRLFVRSVLDGCIRAGPEVLQPAEEDHDSGGERGRKHSNHRRRPLH